MLLPKQFALAILCAGAASAHAAFTINEIEADETGTDATEFVEIKGDPNTSVAGLTLVFYNGNGGVSYLALDLTGSTDANGFYLAGNSGVTPAPSVTWPDNTLQNGEDAVALYSGTNAAAFPNGTSKSSAPGTLVDSIAYETGADTDIAGGWAPLNTAVYQEGGITASLGRYPDGTGGWSPQPSTPGAPNPGQTPTLTPASVDFGAFNTAATTTRTATISNNSPAAFTVSQFALDASTSTVFSVISGPAPAVPVTLQPGESTSVTLQFNNSNTASSQVFGGAINYTTDAQSNAVGSIPISAQFVQIVSPAVAGSIVINELCYDPNAGTTGGGTQDFNNDNVRSTTEDEFVEFYNSTNSPINIQGWMMKTSTNQYILPVNTIIGAHGFLALFSGGTPTGFAPGTAIASGIGFSNAGTKVELTDGTTRADGVAYLAGEDSPDTDGYTNLGLTSSGGSIGRVTDGASTFQVFATANVTPATSNGTIQASVTDWTLFN
jgi:hypothetical protein